MSELHQSRFLFSKKMGERLALGGVAIGTTAIIGLSGMVSAAPKTGTPPNVVVCQSQYMKYGFKNRGECISWWNQHHGGFGYGGNHGQGHGRGNHGNHHHHGFFSSFGDWFGHFFGHHH
jgi:hypothetical protein